MQAPCSVGGERGERRLKPSSCPAGLMRKHRHLGSAAGNPDKAHGLPRKHPDTRRARRLQPPLAALGALPRRWAPSPAHPAAPPRARRAPPASAAPALPPPALLTPRRPWRGDPGPSAAGGGGGRDRKGVGSGSTGAAALPRLRRHEGPDRAGATLRRRARRDSAAEGAERRCPAGVG